jgi:hypothetical protein
VGVLFALHAQKLVVILINSEFGVGEKCARHVWNFKNILVAATLAATDILHGNLKGTLPTSIEFHGESTFEENPPAVSASVI